MFKQVLAGALSLILIAFTSSISSADIITWEGNDDVGDGGIRAGIRAEMFKMQNQTGQDFRQQCDRLQKLKQSFLNLTESEITAQFGPRVERKPNTFALPMYDAGVMVVSGLARLAPNWQDVPFYEIGDFAAAKIYYNATLYDRRQHFFKSPKWDNVYTIFFYFRVDESFPKLRGWNNLKSRLEWENARLKRLENCLAEHRVCYSKVNLTSTQ